MEAEKFKQMTLDKSQADYGMCPPPTKAQEGLKILIDHFLGEDWYMTMPVCQEQVNTEAIYQILSKYPKKKSFKELFKNKI
jgi:hypothetical protein